MSSQPVQYSPQRIVVGVDGSEGSRSAVRWAAAEAEAHSPELEAVMARLPALPLPLFGPGSTPVPTNIRPLDLEGSDRQDEEALTGRCGRSSAVGSLPS